MKTKQKQESFPTIQETMITPAMARNWLENSKFDNRNVSDRLVNTIARDIKAGKWVMDANPIRFNKKGDVIDGQHRLWAIIQSERSVRSWIALNVDDEAINTIDTGKSRNSSDILHFNGYKYTNNLANACRINIGYRGSGENLFSDWAKNRSMTRLSSAELLKEAGNKPLTEAVAHLANNKFVKKFVGIGLGAFCYYIFAKLSKTQADEFFYLLSEGIDLPQGSPILALRNCLTIREHIALMGGLKGGNYRQAYLIALVFKTWNLWRDGNTITRIMFRPDTDKYPVPR